ncbi:DNA glycosylase AlkZ-like family protein [Nonomuraea dietziae]|uniref:DNA glycosylase AlkZ-like family protein n=1 Tax=Nonomuraea dietziae TaxID=65515 RepID=UPI00337C9967
MPNQTRSARMTAQLLHRPPGLGPGEMVRHLLAVQAQDVPSALLAFRARSATLTVAQIEDAWRSREIVRAWGPRAEPSTSCTATICRGCSPSLATTPAPCAGSPRKVSRATTCRT